MVGLEKKIHIGECFGEVNLFEVSPVYMHPKERHGWKKFSI